MNRTEHYIKALTTLRPAQLKSEKAPYKPVLLLSIIEAIETNEITDNKIHITPELVARFKTNWSILVNTTVFTNNFALPFFHLKNEKVAFWHLHPQAGYEKSLKITKSIGSLNVLTNSVAYAELKPELFNLLKTEHSRLATSSTQKNSKNLKNLKKKPIYAATHSKNSSRAYTTTPAAYQASKSPPYLTHNSLMPATSSPSKNQATTPYPTASAYPQTYTEPLTEDYLQ